MDEATVLGLLAGATRIVIAGGPKTGKTTLAVRLGKRLGRQTRHSDSLVKSHEWGDDSAEVARWFDEPGDWIVEGVTMARALRKWMTRHEGKAPDVTVVYCREPMLTRSKGQETMARGEATVWRETEAKLRQLGVRIISR